VDKYAVPKKIKQNISKAFEYKNNKKKQYAAVVILI
jgi:hypothetical protein